MNKTYNDIAEQYSRSKFLPFRYHIENYTVSYMLGVVKGKSILDLACGDGFYTRRFKQWGAADAVGVDVSSEMIQLASEEELYKPLGCEYICMDVAKFRPKLTFDIVTAIYLFGYAKTKEELKSYSDTCFTS